jgi:hypothetical protein
MTTEKGHDETEIYIGPGGFPDDVELTGYINYDDSVELLHAIIG